MSRFDELIFEFCPDGVEYRKLSEICSKAKTIRWDNANDSRFYIDLSSVDIDTHIIGELEQITAENAPSRARQVVKENDLLFATTRPTQMRCCVIPALLDNQICSTGYCVLRFNDMSVDVRFAFHWLTTDNFKAYLENNQTEGNYPAISDKKLREFEIPVPPIEIQRELVRILDSFTDLTDELIAQLTGEIEARRAQYTHYRDRLLSWESLEAMDGKPVEMKRLDACGDFERGKRFTKNDYRDNGIPCIHYAEVYTEYHLATSRTVSFVRNDMGESLRFATKGDLVIACTGETKEDIAKSIVWEGDEPVAVHDDCHILHISDGLNSRYLSYCFQTDRFTKSKMTYATKGKTVRIAASRLASIEIPVPSLATQQKVVDILDRFDALTTSLTDGLPAEIEARRAQYAYYRDRLLDFPRKEAAAS